MSDDMRPSGEEQVGEEHAPGLHDAPEQESPSPEPPAGPVAPMPEPVATSAARQPINPGLLALGLITPWIAAGLTGALANGLSMVGLPAFGLSAVASVLPLAVLVGMIVAFVRGRATGNANLRSFGLGGIISYVVTMLLSLLAFGACFVTGVFQL